MLRYVLLGIFFFLLWRAVRPYVTPQLKGKPEGPTPLPPPRTNASPSKDEIDGKTPHEILGVRRDAAWTDVQSAYKRLVGEYHPDKASNLAPEVRSLMTERTRQLNRAYEILSKRKR